MLGGALSKSSQDQDEGYTSEVGVWRTGYLVGTYLAWKGPIRLSSGLSITKESTKSKECIQLDFMVDSDNYNSI